MRQFGDKLLTYPAKSNVQRLREKIRLCIKSALGLSQEALLRKLNPLLRGWANYYRNGASKRTFKQLDYFVFWQLWGWAKRRHPDKSAGWKQRKYFSAAGRPGIFSVRFKPRKGQSHVLELYRIASTKIKRHIKIRGAANPYDLQDASYFEQRRRRRRRTTSTGSITPLAESPFRTVSHWLQFAAACPHLGAPVAEA